MIRTIDDGTVGVVGVGALGSVVAGRFSQAGFDTLVYDALPGRAHEIAQAIGGRSAASLEELSDASFVVCLLPDSLAVEAVLLGDKGLFASLTNQSLILDMGSSDPRQTIALTEHATKAGIEYADAPVSGGLERARAGELTVMFGGDEALLLRAQPLLTAVSTHVIHVGPVGSAHAMKALNNLLSAMNLAGSLEVMEIGRRFGIDAHTMLETINASTGQNNATLTKIGRILDGSPDSGFALRLMVKDIATATAIARETQAPSPLADACADIWQLAEEVLPDGADQLALSSVLWTEATPSGSVAETVLDKGSHATDHAQA